VHISIDHDLFRHVPVADKKRQVAFMQRKHNEEVFQVVSMLKFRNQLDWQFVLIDNDPAEEVARVMGESAVFLEFGYPAGCPVPPLEALASGCYVIGYTGFGAEEYACKSSNFMPIRHADTSTFAKVIENTCNWFDMTWENDGMLKMAEKRSKRNAEYIQQAYNLDVEANDVLKFWKGILE
jgi:glycosyltransferase involved in cell wall biosynthesis